MPWAVPWAPKAGEAPSGFRPELPCARCINNAEIFTDMALKFFIGGPGPYYRLPGDGPEAGQTLVALEGGRVNWGPAGGTYAVDQISATATGGARLLLCPP